MLVLSRRADESIVFPTLGITVKLLRVDRTKAKLGISAPPNVRILRQEIGADGFETQQEAGTAHEVRNRLNTISLAMLLYQQQADSGQHEAASHTFEKLLEELSEASRDAASREIVAKPSPLRLLLVEDDKRQRELLGGYLRHRGCEIDLAESAPEAARLLADRRQRPDFVLLDLNLPGTDGAETIRTIRHSERGDDLRILAVSASNPESINAKSREELRIDRWFPKPTNPEALLTHMNQRMNGLAQGTRA